MIGSPARQQPRSQVDSAASTIGGAGAFAWPLAASLTETWRGLAVFGFTRGASITGNECRALRASAGLTDAVNCGASSSERGTTRSSLPEKIQLRKLRATDRTMLKSPLARIIERSRQA